MSGLAALIVGVPLASTAAAGFGAYKGLEHLYDQHTS